MAEERAKLEIEAMKILIKTAYYVSQYSDEYLQIIINWDKQNPEISIQGGE